LAAPMGFEPMLQD